jgi:hypothetical protein
VPFLYLDGYTCFLFSPLLFNLRLWFLRFVRMLHCFNQSCLIEFDISLQLQDKQPAIKTSFSSDRNRIKRPST